MALNVIDDFEAYGDNYSLNVAGEWGTSGFSYLKTTTEVPPEGSVSAGVDTDSNATGYIATQSNADGSASNQSGTFPSYPSPDCTVRAGAYTEGSDSFIDMAFAVPDNSNNFNSNCYRVRAGSGEIPHLYVSENGTETTLVQFSNPISSGEYFDIAVSWIDTGSQIEFEVAVYVWDSTNGWGKLESNQIGTDPNRVHTSSTGIAMAMLRRATSEFNAIDYYRFYDSAGELGTPSYQVEPLTSNGTRGFASVQNGALKSRSQPWLLDL